jgi:hypothetical protein
MLMNAFCLLLCVGVALAWHPWFSLVPILGMSWTEERKP